MGEKFGREGFEKRELGKKRIRKSGGKLHVRKLEKWCTWFRGEELRNKREMVRGMAVKKEGGDFERCELKRG